MLSGLLTKMWPWAPSTTMSPKLPMGSAWVVGSARAPADALGALGAEVCEIVPEAVVRQSGSRVEAAAAVGPDQLATMSSPRAQATANTCRVQQALTS